MRYYFAKRAKAWLPLLGLMLPIGLLRAQEWWRSPSEYDPDWTRHFRIGVLLGLNIKASFQASGPFAIPSSSATGVYDDGYVLPSGLQNGYTSNWGYDNQSQNPTGTDILLMHRASSFNGGGSAEGKDSAFVGFDLEYGGQITQWGSARIGWDFGFGLLPINIKANESLAGTINGDTYTFNTGNPYLPEAPYRGNSSSSPESSIRTDYTVSSGSIGAGTLMGEQSLDAILYTFRLGPSIYWDISPYIGVSASAGPAIGFVSGSLDYNGSVTLDSTGYTTTLRGSANDSDLVYGGYINAAIMYHVVKNGDFYLSAQYMPMSAADIGGTGHAARLKLGGQVYFAFGVNWPF